LEQVLQTVGCGKFSQLTHTTFSGFRAKKTAEAVTTLALPQTPRQCRVLMKALQRLPFPIAWLDQKLQQAGLFSQA